MSIGNAATRDGQHILGAALPAGALTPGDVHDIRFQPTKYREGYDQDEIDDFMDRIVWTLKAFTEAGIGS